MSHSINVKKNIHQKVNPSQYLYNSDKPEDDSSHNINEVQNSQLKEQSDRYYMIIRRQLRQNAQRIRRH
jgi:hypothetical protein